MGGVVRGGWATRRANDGEHRAGGVSYAGSVAGTRVEHAATAGYPYEIEYLHVALVTALLAQGKREDAKRAWQAVLEVKSERFKRTPMALLLEATVNADRVSK